MKKNKIDIITESGLFLVNILESDIEEVLKNPYYLDLQERYGLNIGEQQPCSNEKMAKGKVGLYVREYKDFLAAYNPSSSMMECECTSFTKKIC